MNSSCQVCGTVLDKSGAGVRICPTCGQSAHSECWSHLGGCIHPGCRKQAREATEAAAPALGQRRHGALIRRRLSWIIAQEMRMAPDFHPDERKLSMGAGVCAACAVCAEALEFGLFVQFFGPSTILLAGLLLLHRGQRKRGQIHRWIPADSAPEKAMKVADWLLFVESSDERGRPIKQFTEDYLGEPGARELFDRASRMGLFLLQGAGSQRNLALGPRGEDFVREAKKRRAPEAVTKIQ